MTLSFRDRIAQIAGDFEPEADKYAGLALAEMRAALKAALADCLEENDVETYAGYTPEVQNILTDIAGDQAGRRAYWATWARSEKNADGVVLHYDADGKQMFDPPADYYFGLSYASWLVLPRLALQEMPPPWQAEFFRMLNEAETLHGLACPDDTYVMRKRGGKFINNSHWNNYRRGTVSQAQAIDNA